MLSMESAISEVAFSTKERNAVQLLGILTVKDFLQVDLEKVFDLRGYGATTYTKLKRNRDRLRAELFPDYRDTKEAAHSQYHDEKIAALGLTARGLKALRQVKVNTVREFLFLDLAAVESLKNCGAITRQHLAKLQADLRERSGTDFPKDTTDRFLATSQRHSTEAVEQFARQEAKPYSWRNLPLFSGRPLQGITPADLHPSYHPDVPMRRLMTTGRVQRAVAEKGITCLGEMLLTPGGDLIGHGHAGSGILARAQSLVEGFLKQSMNGSPRAEIDTRSPEDFLVSLLYPVVSNERQRLVLLERMGWRSDPRTLKEVGLQFNLTRERIRQIEQAGLRKLTHWQAAHSLEPLHELILGMLRDLAPVISLRGICKALQMLYGWNKSLHEEAIARFLPAFSDLKCVDEQHVCLHNFRCIDCSSLPKALENALDGTQEKRIGLSAMARRLRAQMLKAEDCQRCSVVPNRSSVSLLRIAFARSAIASKWYRFVKGELLSRDHWRSTRGPISELLESILKGHPGPMSYRDIHDAAHQTRQHELTPEMVWQALSASVQRGTDILLWDRGGLYQHKTHVNLYTPVLNKIEKWIIQSLSDGPFPQLSTNAAFQVFREECLAAGLTSEYAIHSCLKHRQHPKLAFYHSPYLGLAAAGSYRVPNVEIAEGLLRQEGDIFPKDKLKSLMCGQMGLKSYQFTQIIDQLDNVIRTQHGFLHADYFDAASPDFKALAEYAAQRAAKDGEVSAQILYKERIVSCLQLRIDGPRMLYYLLEFFAPKGLQTAGYPIVLRKVSTDTREVRGVRERVVHFIRQKREPVSCDEIRIRFVKKLGFKHRTVFAATKSDDVARYLNGFLVHIDTLDWNSTKEDALRAIAEAHYDSQVSAGASFARVDHLLEIHESSFPVLGKNVAWTPTLLATMLSRDADTPVVGPMENAYIVNKDGVAVRTFGDFLRLILTNHFEGAASLRELSQWLRDERVIQKMVTPAMVRGDGLIIEGQTVRVRRPDEC
ncbi:MAG: hypothetical protein GXY83_09765 [Rhodopirellula sp.]|nr:hypothetical protein [Rhodopirellula sp.]